MSRESDAIGLLTQAARDLDVDDRQRDREPPASGKHLVEETVARVVIAFLIAAKAFEFEEAMIERSHCGAWRLGGLDERTNSFSEVRKRLKAERDVDFWADFGSQNQSTFRQANLALGFFRKRHEAI